MEAAYDIFIQSSTFQLRISDLELRIENDIESDPATTIHNPQSAIRNRSSRLPAIARLEGFHPGGSCLYRRILAPVWAAGAVFPAWLYVGEDSTMIRSTLTERPRWP